MTPYQFILLVQKWYRTSNCVCAHSIVYNEMNVLFWHIGFGTLDLDAVASPKIEAMVKATGLPYDYILIS